MFSLLQQVFSKLPSVDEVEGYFKVVRFFIWNLFELLLLIVAMIAIGSEALTHVPAFRLLFDPPAAMGAPPATPPSQPSPPGTPLEPQGPRKDRTPPKRQSRPSPLVVPVAVHPNRLESPPIVTTAAMQVEPTTYIPVETAAAEPAGTEDPADHSGIEPRSNPVIRVMKLPVRGIRAAAGRVVNLFRNRHGADRGDEGGVPGDPR